jgi:hypothetical protein
MRERKCSNKGSGCCPIVTDDPGCFSDRESEQHDHEPPPFDTLMVPEFPGGVMVKTSPSPSAPAPHKPALIQVVILRLAIELAERLFGRQR